MNDPAPLVLNDRYELRSLIGRGGMAEVYRGYDRVLGREVAVKVMHPALSGDVDRRRFASETRLLASLNHPQLVMLLDAGVDDAGASPRPWVVMELVEGPTLARRLDDGPLPAEVVGAIGADLATALAHVHAKGIVHRDVKPANVLLTGDESAKLADFGVARLVDEQSDLTDTGHTIGTAAYLAPEQVRGRSVTGASDVYSLGLVLLEALTGRRAFVGTATEAALARLSSSPLIPVSLGAAWVQLLDEMTASDPGRRPGAGEVVARLEAIRSGAAPSPSLGRVGLGSTGTMAVPVAVSDPPGSARPVLAGVVATACLLAAAGLAWVSTAGPGSEPPPAGAAERTSRTSSAAKDQSPRGVAPSPEATSSSPTTEPDRNRGPRKSVRQPAHHPKKVKKQKAGKPHHGKKGHGKKPKRKHKHKRR